MTPKLRKLLKATGVALGVTSIYLLCIVDPLVTSTHNAVYHWIGSPSQLFAAPLLDFCAFWLLLTLMLMFAPGRVRDAIWFGIIGFTPWMALKNWAYLTNAKPPSLLSPALLVIALVVFLLPLALRRPAFEKRFEQVERFASMLFLISAVNGVIILCQIAWFGWQARSLNAELPLHHAVNDRTAQTGRPRVIWILFDELSYEQVYERRFPGLQLPSFDALAAQSTVFTHTTPAGIFTEYVLPSLMTGEPFDDARSSANGRQLSLHNSNTGAWQWFDEYNTIFQDALNLNYETAVAGWYNPYCRILPDVLDHCFWTFSASAENTMVPGAKLRSNMLQPWMRFFGNTPVYRFATSFLPIPEMIGLHAKQHIADYVALADAADRILEDKSAGFAFLHLPVPHPFGIYDRTTGKFALKNSTYLDNLALTDKLLGHIRSKLEQSGQWDSSTIVIMADHSWRTELLWKHERDWTNEEEMASRGGEFDDRPAYIVKLAEQHTGARIDVPFAALNTRRLFGALLSQKIRSKEDLAAWAEQTEPGPKPLTGGN